MLEDTGTVGRIMQRKRRHIYINSTYAYPFAERDIPQVHYDGPQQMAPLRSNT